MKPPRFTLRRWMLLVACMGVLIAYLDRWRRYQGLAAHHAALAWQAEQEAMRRHPPYLIWVPMVHSVVQFHQRKSEEYARGSLRPWVVVRSETPPPAVDGWPPGGTIEEWRTFTSEVEANSAPVASWPGPSPTP